MAGEDEKSTDVEPIQDDEIIAMKEAIKILDTTRSTFYRWLRSGQIKGMKAGRRWRFYRADIERFLKGQEPRIDVPVGIHPLVELLRERAGNQRHEIEQRDHDEPVDRAERVLGDHEVLDRVDAQHRHHTVIRTALEQLQRINDPEIAGKRAEHCM